MSCHKRISPCAPLLEPGEQCRSATTGNRPYHAVLNGLAEQEVLQTEKEDARKKCVRENSKSRGQLSTPPKTREAPPVGRAFLSVESHSVANIHILLARVADE